MAHPFAPLPPDPSHSPRKKERDARTTMRLTALGIAAATVLAFVLGSSALILVAVVVWIGWGFNFLLLTRVLDPRGEDTPYVNQHSGIQAMVMRGEYAKAAQAYRDVIATDPADRLACEQLALLALQELKDYETAVFAYREAEKRHTVPGKKLTFGMMAAETIRDRLRDPGRAVVELRRLLATYPDAPNAAALRNELELLKSHLFENP